MRLGECKRRKTIERATVRDQWESPRSGLPGCQASCGLFVTMQCDSNGDSVLGAMSLMMNSSTTIITLYLPPPFVSAYRHTRVRTKHHNLPTNTHTDATSPQPLQHSATYIWCWRVQGLRLAQASQPPADSGECSCSVWRGWMADYSFCWNKCPKLCTVHINLYARPSHEHTRADSKRELIHTYMHLDLRIDPNKCCCRSGLMTSCPLLIQLRAL